MGGLPVSYLDLARRLREAEADPGDLHQLTDARVVEVRERIAAVRLRSPVYGDVWLALDPGTAAALAAEAPGVPVLSQEDVVRLRSQSPEMVLAVLGVMAAFPGARMVQ